MKIRSFQLCLIHVIINEEDFSGVDRDRILDIPSHFIKKYIFKFKWFIIDWWAGGDSDNRKGAKENPL